MIPRPWCSDRRRGRRPSPPTIRSSGVSARRRSRPDRARARTWPRARRFGPCGAVRWVRPGSPASRSATTWSCTVAGSISSCRLRTRTRTGPSCRSASGWRARRREVNATIDNVLNSVRTRVEGLGLALNTVAIPVVKRKLPLKEEAIDPATQITISLAELLPAPLRLSIGTLVYRLPVEVTLITPSKSDFVQSLPALSDWYGTVRDAFAQAGHTRASLPVTLPAGTDVIWKVQPAEGVFLDRPKLNLAYDYQTQIVNVWVLTITR